MVKVLILKMQLSKAGDPMQQDRSNERTTLAHLRHAPAMYYLTLLVHEHALHTIGSSTYVSTTHAQQSDKVLHKVTTSREASA
ncbi:Cysteine protease [Giardia duodenalis]|uniref:Cysteine protease n=1 Tax=Giardia intestinalis TaxID=5741 RepID=V6U3N4_GIAIN|nr:Cysteine protease [Giardia intestinalis]